MSDERDSSTLTPTQRAFLRGEKTYSGKYAKQQRYDRRVGIKKRVWNGFLDGEILFNHMPAQLREDVFEGWREYAGDVETPDDSDEQSLSEEYYDAATSRGQWLERVAVGRGFAGWIAFLYLGISQSEEFDFEHILQLAVTRAERARGQEVTSFELRIDTQPNPDIDELRARFEDRDEISASEMKQLRDAGEVTDDELVSYYNELRVPEPPDTV